MSFGHSAQTTDFAVDSTARHVMSKVRPDFFGGRTRFICVVDGASELGLHVAGFIHALYLTTQIERLAKAGHAIPHGASLSEDDFLRGVKLILDTCANALHKN